MSALSEAISQRMTLGDLRSHYGLTIVPSFAEDVTVTSLVTDLGSVRPGSLYIPYLDGIDNKIDDVRLSLVRNTQVISDDTDSSSDQNNEGSTGDYDTVGALSEVEEVSDLIHQAELRGAYAIWLPDRLADDVVGSSIPILLGDLNPADLGQILSNIAGDPSLSIAVFAVAGNDVSNAVVRLGEFLHTLGNPVGVVSKAKLMSLDHPLDLVPPLNMFDVQRALSICLEDGVAALVIAVDDETLQADALQSVQLDVLAMLPEDENDSIESETEFESETDGNSSVNSSNKLSAISQHFGFALSSQLQVVRSSEATDHLAQQTLRTHDESRINDLSLDIAMTMAVGVKRSHIRHALESVRDSPN